MHGGLQALSVGVERVSCGGRFGGAAPEHIVMMKFIHCRIGWACLRVKYTSLAVEEWVRLYDPCWLPVGQLGLESQELLFREQC
jgi:hypothetical protein